MGAAWPRRSRHGGFGGVAAYDAVVFDRTAGGRTMPLNRTLAESASVIATSGAANPFPCESLTGVLPPQPALLVSRLAIVFLRLQRIPLSRCCRFKRTR